MGLDIYFIKTKKREVGYFRKVNFLVKFFEDRGFDVPNQVPLRITKKDVEELIDACKKVKETPSLGPELLPTMSGFFFGSTDYDQYYEQDVAEVLRYCQEELLPLFDKLEDDEDIYFETWY